MTVPAHDGAGMTEGRPPRIGYLVQQFPPEVGAGPARVAEMALRWRRAGAEVTVFTGMPNRPAGVIHPDYRGRLSVRERWEGIEVVRSWLYASPRHGFARTLANSLTFMLTGAASAAFRGRGVDVLIASSPPWFVHFAGAAAARRLRVPLVLEVRDLWPDYLAGMGVVRGASARAVFAAERRLLRGAAHVVVVTESFRRRVLEKGVDPARVSLLPNAVDPALYRRTDEAPPLPELARRPGEAVVGYLGNFGKAQDLPSVIEAARLLADAGEGVRMVLAGDGTDRAAVVRAAREAAVPGLVVRGTIAKEDTRAFYNALDACVVPLAPLPQLQEAIPSKLFEAMACETPVIAALAGEGAAIVRRAGCGLVTPPGDPGALADAIRRMAALSADERARMGRAGRAYVVAHHDRGRIAADYLALLRRLARPS